MELFKLNEPKYEVEISPEALILKPFHKILARDRSTYKKRAKAELAYIWFMYDFKSDFMSEIDEELRSESIITTLDGLPKDWKPDKIVKDAADFYKVRSATIASKALDKQRANIDTLIDKIGTFMSDGEVGVVEKAAKLSSQVPILLKTIDTLDQIVKGQQESGKSTHRGSQDKAMFEDDI